ncbi:MAG TPA: M2 family metallopeptidase [Xanthomonadales bacterium]|nr:M2 family metallopeptidase [Xanthomonadales bacterium]
MRFLQRFFPVMCLALLSALTMVACKPATTEAQAVATAVEVQEEVTPELTVADAVAFVEAAELRLGEAEQHAERVEWVYSTYIMEDTARLSAQATEELTAARVELAGEASRFMEIEGLDPVTFRKLNMIRSGIVVPAPADPEKIAEQAEIGAMLGGMYGAGKYCKDDGECLSLEDLEDIIDNSRDPEALLEAWAGWRTVSPAMKPLYERQVELANEGARELGFDDLGTMWRSDYDMPPEDFPGELDRLWEQVNPLYEALHCHVRARLNEQYGDEVVPPNGLIPAHLLGNMWAQSWDNIYDIVGPESSDPGYDLTALLNENEFDAIRMVETGENFFSSLGFEPLPETFWSRSQFTKPRDREVVCHPSAWNVDADEDLRIKMCIDVIGEDFRTIHHELGHNYYQRAYNQETYLHRNGANDGFHEAVGDTLSLSITPAYLVQIGLLENEPGASGDIGLLMARALQKVAFLPFGLLVDQWRWKVFAGEITPDQYNQAWWDLRARYQGIGAPIERPTDAFDPGAKYHVPGNTPYMRYFLAHIQQFQFFKALCDISGYEGPVHRCSFYGSDEAGQRLNAMLEMGRTKPWPDALEALTGTREMDGTAVLDYFAPLKVWLDEQNADRECGW